LQERGIKSIETVVTKKESLAFISIYLHKYFRDAECQLCMTDLFKQLSYSNIFEQNELKYIDKIFSAINYDEARLICEDSNKMDFNNINIFKNLNKELHNIAFLYNTNKKYRNIICTNNIITYIEHYLKILLKVKVFPIKNSVELDVINYIYFTTEEILKNGKLFIPNWDFLIKKIDK